MKKKGEYPEIKKNRILYESGKNKTAAIETENYEGKISRHKKAGLLKTALIIVVAGVAISSAFYVWQNKNYKGYKVISSTKREDTVTTKYEEYNGKIIKYSRDGASYTDTDNRAIWNQTYEMQFPIIDICEEYAAIGDRDGNKVYIFNAEGLQGEIDTLLPIQQIEVSNQGVVAAVLEDENITWINFYDKENNLLAENKTTMANSGYPIDIALSNDGLKLAVSYMSVNSGIIKTNVAFYNFGSVGQNEIDNLVSGYEYEKTVISSLEFIDNTTAIALGDNKITIYEGRQKPLLTAEIDVKEEAESVFYNEKYIGLVFDNEDAENRYKMEVYNLKGKKILDKEFDRDYHTIKIDDNRIILFTDLECSIYNLGGVEKFHGSFEKELVNIIPYGNFNKYIIINVSETEKIKLK